MLLTLSAPSTISGSIYVAAPNAAPMRPNVIDEKCLATLPDVLHVIAKVRAGDANAFNQIVECYQRLAYSIAFRIFHREDAAVDAVQESFFKAFRALPQFRGGCFKSWLTRIVVNTCYDMLRGHDHRSTVALEDLPQTREDNVGLVAATESPEAHVQRGEIRDWLERGLHKLPTDQRVVVLLYDVHGYSYEEIAEITGVPMGTVKSRINRGRLRFAIFCSSTTFCPPI